MANGRWDTYLTVEGISGESKRAGHEGEIELAGFDMSGTNISSVGTGSGGGTGTVSLSTFNVRKQTDASSAELFQALCTGSHFPKAVLTMYVSGGDAGAVKKVLFEFEEVYVENMLWAGDENSAVPVPEENISFAYGKVAITYNEQKPDGTIGGSHVGSWDRRTGTK